MTTARKKKTITKSRKLSVSPAPEGKRTKNRASVEFLQKPSCTTCRNARAYMEQCGFDLRLRDIGKDRLRAEEVEKLIGKRDYKTFLNTRNEIYRRKNMKENPPSRAEAIKMIAEEPNLIRRPIIIAGNKIILGFDQESIDGLQATRLAHR
jgi:Spx/MgsR family transcriptional regulator